MRDPARRTTPRPRAPSRRRPARPRLSACVGDRLAPGATVPSSSAAVVTPSASVVGTGMSSGGGRRSVTAMAGHGSAWSSRVAVDELGQRAGGPAAVAGDRRPAEPGAGSQEARSSLILSHRSSASRRSSAWSTIRVADRARAGSVDVGAARAPSAGRRRRRGSNFRPWVIGLKTRKYGAASVPQPAVHCQPCWLEARSPSTSHCMKCRAPCCHSRCRSLTRKLATIIRTRLCIQPVAPQLAHPGVDDREAGAALAATRRAGRRARRTPSARTPAAGSRARSRAGGRARRRRTPARRAPCGRSSRAGAARPRQVGEHRARVDLAPLEVHRHARGAVDAGPVALARRSRRAGRRGTPASAAAPPPRRPSGRLEPVGQRRRPGCRSVSSTSQPATPPVGGVDRAAPAVLGPGPRERREDLVRRRRRPWSPGPARRRTASRCAPARCRARPAPARPRSSRRAAVRPEVGGDVHPVGADLPRGQHDPAHRVAAHHAEPGPPLPRAASRARSDAAEVGAARRPGRPPERRVEHEQRQHRPVGGGLEQGRVVARAGGRGGTTSRRHGTRLHPASRVRAVGNEWAQ